MLFIRCSPKGGDELPSNLRAIFSEGWSSNERSYYGIDRGCFCSMPSRQEMGDEKELMNVLMSSRNAVKFIHKQFSYSVFNKPLSGLGLFSQNNCQLFPLYFIILLFVFVFLGVLIS